VESLEDNIACFIFVGGKSSRFEEDKANYFYKIQYEKCKKIFKKVYFVAKRKKFKNYPFFIEKSKTYAPIFALEEIIRKYKRVFVLSVDTPLVYEKDLKRLLRKKAVAKDNPLIGYYDYLMLKNFDKKSLRVFPINKRKIKIKNTQNINYKEELKLLGNKIGKRIKFNI